MANVNIVTKIIYWMQIVLAAIQGTIIAAYFIGLAAMITEIRFRNGILELIRGVIVMLQVPLLYVVLPLLVIFSSATISIYKFILGRPLDASEIKLIKVHKIYLRCLAIVVIYWTVFYLKRHS